MEDGIFVLVVCEFVIADTVAGFPLECAAKCSLKFNRRNFAFMSDFIH